MVVGICQIRLIIQDACSLKAKRSVLKSILDRVRNRFPVSVAEVGDQDLWQSSIIGFCTVSNEQQVVHTAIDNVVDFIEDLCLAEVNVAHIEIITL